MMPRLAGKSRSECPNQTVRTSITFGSRQLQTSARREKDCCCPICRVKLALSLCRLMNWQSSGSNPARFDAYHEHRRFSSAIIMSATERPDDGAAMCRACGACCSFSSEWPRFSVEDDADLDRIPPAFVDDGEGRMRCHGDRCSALVGDVGLSTSCAVYAARPEVCRACLPGDDACRMARRRFNLTPQA